MHLFPCPFCGPRDEAEFHYAGEAGNVRPGGASVSAEAWADYLFMRSNPKGPTREIWVHMSCGEFFVMQRNSVTHTVFASKVLDETEKQL